MSAPGGLRDISRGHRGFHGRFRGPQRVPGSFQGVSEALLVFFRRFSGTALVLPEFL